MTQARQRLAWGAIVASAALFAGQAAIAAPEQPDAAKAAVTRKAPPNAAEKALDRGIAAYQKNALARAVGALSSAMSLGGLDTSGTARALYFRGLAYRKQGQTALAMSDLNNALWLGNGLSATERADAMANRAAVYQATGIADPGAPAAVALPALATPGVTAPAVETTTSTATPAAAQPAPVASGFKTAVAPAAPPASSPPASNPLSGVGSFFSNLFSGGSGQTAEAVPGEVTTASTANAGAPAVAPTAGSGAKSAISSWNSATEVVPGKTTSPAKPAPSGRTAALATTNSDAARAPALVLKGKYKLQVAAVRSRAEAESVAQRFSMQHGSSLGGRTPVIEEAVFGNMGTFYRVNVGPFVSQADPDKLCQSMRGAGYDCLVVTH